MVRGEALNRQEDDLRLRQRELDEAKRVHEHQLAINTAISCQRVMTTRRGGTRQLTNPVQLSDNNSRYYMSNIETKLAVDSSTCHYVNYLN
jgi:hypothetical protein